MTYQVDHDVTIFVEAHNEYGYVAGASVTIQRGSQKETYHISSDRLENGKTYTMKISSAECAF